MWELYALYAFVPVWLAAYVVRTGAEIDIPLWSFFVIAVGFVGCVGGGLLSVRWPSATVAAVQLAISGLCCILSPWFFDAGLPWLVLLLAVWGITVAGDSPQFSTLNAETAPRDYVGSALTIANSIGFFITVASIQTLSWLVPLVGPQHVYWLRVPGPILGLIALRPVLRKGARAG